MSKIISIVSQKGGAGKSTVTTLVANILFHHYGYKVAIIDADFPQFCIFKRREEELHITKNSEKLTAAFNLLYKDRQPYPIIPIKLQDCLKELDKMEAHFDFIFIDLAGSIYQKGILKVFNRVNHFFIPALPDGFSLKSAIEFYDFIYQAVQLKSPNFITAHLFFNKIPGRNTITKYLKIIQKVYPFLPIFLSNYIIYEKSYRSTLFPIPKAKMEGIKVAQFTQLLLTAMNQPASILPSTVLSK